VSAVDTPNLSLFPILPFARSLGNNGIGAEGAFALAAILKETNVTNLNLQHNFLPDEAKQAVKDAFADRALAALRV